MFDPIDGGALVCGVKLNILVCADSDSSKNGDSGISEAEVVACRDGRLGVHAEMVGSIVAVCGCGLPHVRKTSCSSYHALCVAEADPSRFGHKKTFRVAKLVRVLRACVWLGCARGDVPCRCRNVSRMRARASLDAHHHHQQQLAANSDV